MSASSALCCNKYRLPPRFADSLSDILVLHQALSVEVSSTQRDEVDIVTLDQDLVLLCGVLTDSDTLSHVDPAHPLLAEEVPDLETGAVLLDDHVDGEMGVDGSALVLEAEGNTLDHVVNDRLGGSQASQVLASSVPDDELDLVTLG